MDLNIKVKDDSPVSNYSGSKLEHLPNNVQYSICNYTPNYFDNFEDEVETL